jgi:hypothetical protein
MISFKVRKVILYITIAYILLCFHTFYQSCNPNATVLKIPLQSIVYPTCYRRVTSELSPGIGHRLTEIFFVARYAILNGICFCFDTHSFGDGLEFYELILKPVFPDCSSTWNSTPIVIDFLTFSNLSVQNITQATYFQVWIPQDVVWPSTHELRLQNVFSVHDFMDRYLKDNCILQSRIMPWYLGQRKVKVIQNNKNSKVVNLVIHLRVGDIALETSENYWQNVLQTLNAILKFEEEIEKNTTIYFIYFQADHRTKEGVTLQKNLNANNFSWSENASDLPPTHNFLKSLCADFRTFTCVWKHSVSLLESIDLFLTAEFVYLSGSAFSRSLGIFSNGVKIISQPKEFNSFPNHFFTYLTPWTSTFSNSAYYYLDENGTLCKQQVLTLPREMFK